MCIRDRCHRKGQLATSDSVLNHSFYYKTEFGTAIFEDVADVCYNMLDHLEQYKQYLDSMKLIHVPVHMKPSASVASIIQPTTDLAPSQSATATQGKQAK